MMQYKNALVFSGAFCFCNKALYCGAKRVIIKRENRGKRGNGMEIEITCGKAALYSIRMETAPAETGGFCTNATLVFMILENGAAVQCLFSVSGIQSLSLGDGGSVCTYDGLFLQDRKPDGWQADNRYVLCDAEGMCRIAAARIVLREKRLMQASA